jgi:DNA-binding transcriptional regulator YiaG
VANEDNGADRSPADTRFQAKKAFDLLRKKLGWIPKPVELSRATHTSLKFAGAFLRELFSQALSDPEGVDESGTGIPLELQKILDGLKKIKPAINWEPGDKSKPMLSAIAKELRRISRHKRPEAELKPEDLKRFMDAKRINNAQMAKLAEVSHTTVARWLAGKVKMSDSNARILRDAMSYSDEHLAVILDDDATEMDTETGNE